MTKILLTGALGFIGFHVANRLIAAGYEVVGLDNINDYYAVNQKKDKLPLLGISETDLQVNKKYLGANGFSFYYTDLRHADALDAVFQQESFDKVIHLAAQAGVQFSIENPVSCIENNIHAFTNLLESCRKYAIKHLIYASSSSVYGDREEVPFRETDNVDNPISLYAASKKSNELMAHTYSHLFGIKTTGLRFFTVYGPWGRPDMAPFIFMSKLLRQEPITVFNEGNLERDFTYVDDIVAGVLLTLGQTTNYEVFNIGNSQPVNLMYFIRVMEDVLGVKASIDFRPMRKGDVYRTYSDVTKLSKAFQYQPKVSIEEGLRLMADWYRGYYG